MQRYNKPLSLFAPCYRLQAATLAPLLFLTLSAINGKIFTMFVNTCHADRCGERKEFRKKGLWVIQIKLCGGFSDGLRSFIEKGLVIDCNGV